MAPIKIYGIKNCDTMKKAFAWLDAHKIAYDFHDYKKAGADLDVLKTAIAQHGWDSVINRKGTSWRALPDDVKDGMTEKSAIKAAMDNPSLIKRPLIVKGKTIQLGFSPDDYQKLLK
ncbi:ArsC family reductase [Micavibrio aeruginosavorus]|uniref:A glutathione-dependent thiol reductase n=1 Tax=Micavibrio aeruginosavorus EPB TaxID=349215 RepID=M4VGM5_9BACT|nr:ArsC family reductase [Micavibrio aeruginosavorus]AGH97630.1 a glutathione-dependent thiol reductase [Micavibrio aeruginosavorus EPB]